MQPPKPVLRETTPSSMAASQFNSLPNNNFLDESKLKVPADDKINVTEKLKFVFVMDRKHFDKGENDGYQHFLFFPQCFPKAFPRSLKVGIVW